MRQWPEMGRYLDIDTMVVVEDSLEVFLDRSAVEIVPIDGSFMNQTLRAGRRQLSHV